MKTQKQQDVVLRCAQGLFEGLTASQPSPANQKLAYAEPWVLGNAPIVFHGHALVNSHDRLWAFSPIDEAGCWRLGLEAGWHDLLVDIWFIIYLVIHVFKNQVLDTNAVDFGRSSYCAQYIYERWKRSRGP